jgi:hypothetical protein
MQIITARLLQKMKKPKIKKPPILFSKTQKIVKAIEKRLGGTFLTYWNSTSGSVCQNDVIGLYGVLRKLGKQKQVTIFLKSDGGSGLASLRMVNLLRQYASRVVAVVPLECQSAATMLAIGADEIHMGPLAHLSAVDTSITHDLSPIDRDNDRVSVSQDELSRVIKLWQKEVSDKSLNPYQAIFQHIHPLVIGAVHRASSLSTKLCLEILSYHLKNKRKAIAISNALNSNYPSHSYPITLREAERIGLNVHPLDNDVNNLLFQLNECYSEMGQAALTDYDEQNYHDHGILNIIEGHSIQIFFQRDKDWHYRKEERRWVPMNEKSSWIKIEEIRGKTVQAVFHTR